MGPQHPPSDVPLVASPDRMLRGFTCTWCESGLGAAWVRVGGELDLATAPRLERALRAAASRARLLVVDLRRVGFMDCQAMRVIVGAASRARADSGRLVVLRGPAHVDLLFTLTGTADRVEFLDLHPAQPPVQAILQLAAEAPGAP